MMLFLFIFSPALSSALRSSLCFSSFHPPRLHLPGPWGCEAWLSTEAELSKLKCNAEEKSRRQTQANKPKEGCNFIRVCMCVFLWGKCKCHISAYWATWSQMNREIMQLHAATQGGIKAEDRDTEEQIRIESRTVENLRDKVLTVGVFESLWQGDLKERKSEWMVYVFVVNVQGYCIALYFTVLMIFFLPSPLKIFNAF